MKLVTCGAIVWALVLASTAMSQPIDELTSAEYLLVYEFVGYASNNRAFKSNPMQPIDEITQRYLKALGGISAYKPLLNQLPGEPTLDDLKHLIALSKELKSAREIRSAEQRSEISYQPN